LQHAIPSPKTVEIVVRGPFGSEVSRTALSATNALLATLGSLRDSGYFSREPSRWMWRSAYLPDRSKYHELLRNSVGAKPLIPRLSTPDGPIRIGFLLPIATFGGVEKVAYAIAKVLKRLGCELHLFVLGKSIYNRTSEAEGVFKTINFLADDYPLWDGPHNFAGHGLLMGGDPAAKTENVLGLLTGLDVIFNCQVAPVNAVLGELRRRGTKVLGHVHVLDKTGTGRDAGHPYLALAFEHAYDMILTCSEDMIYWLHSMGVPRAKLLHVANAPSYELPAEEVSTILKSRQARKPKALRALFMGRLDTQKGIERLYTAARELQQRDVVIDWQIIGSEVVSDNPEHSWTSRFEDIGIQIRPAIYAAEKLTDELSRADVLVLPSRWEGAPLTILEAQRLGCVPIATAVGAVSELINHGVDGVLLDASDDWGVACDLTAVLQRLASNREELAQLSIGASSRAATVSWTTNIAPLVRQFEAWFPQRWNAMARECLSC
jgi:glycosyltransferase involved in cell wall biosynthesis